RTSPLSRESLPRRRHDLRWPRLHPQLPGADAARGWPELIEHVDVALADALAAPELAAGEQSRVGTVAHRHARALAQAGEHAAGGLQRELCVVVERQRVLPEEGIPEELLALELRVIEERLHAEREDLVLVGEVLRGGGEQVVQADLERSRV